MSWTVPVDFTTGRLVSATDWNAEMGTSGNMSQTAVALASASGQIPYATAANALAMLALSGTQGAVLTAGASAPAWSTNLLVTSANVRAAQGFRAEGTSSPTTGGAAVEAWVNSGEGYLSTYNRTGAAYVNQAYDAAQHRWLIGGSEKARLDSSGNHWVSTTGKTTSIAHLGVGFGMSLFADTATSHGVAFNAYYNSGWKHWNSTGVAALIDTDSSGLNIRMAAAGTADTALTYALCWSISTGGHLLTGTDNAYDIGASAATRPRSIYFATALIGPTGANAGPASTGAIRLGNGSDSDTAIKMRNNTGTSDIALIGSGGGGNSIAVGDGGNAAVTGINFYAGSTTNALVLDSTGHYPVNTNQLPSGKSGKLWTAVWATNGTIQTSHSSAKDFRSEIDPSAALDVVRDTARRSGFHRFTYKQPPRVKPEFFETDEHRIQWEELETEQRRLANYVHVGIKAESAHEWLSPDGQTVNPQTTACVALAAVAGEADEREADVALLRAEIASLRAELQKRRN